MSTELSLFDKLTADVTLLVAPIKGLAVTDAGSAEVAIEHGLQVKQLLKQVEKVREQLLTPLRERTAAINDRAKTLKTPLEEAERLIKRQLGAFEDEKARVRAELQRKADEERAKQEAELQVKQDQERQSNEAALAAFGGGEEEHAAMEEKQVAEAAALKNQLAERDHQIAQQGVKGARREWKCEVTDLDQVPKEFLIRTLNKAAVLAAARGGATSIAGVRIWQETNIALGANTYVPRSITEEVG